MYFLSSTLEREKNLLLLKKNKKMKNEKTHSPFSSALARFTPSCSLETGAAEAAAAEEEAACLLAAGDDDDAGALFSSSTSPPFAAASSPSLPLPPPPPPEACLLVIALALASNAALACLNSCATSSTSPSSPLGSESSERTAPSAAPSESDGRHEPFGGSDRVSRQTRPPPSTFGWRTGVTKRPRGGSMG